MLTTPEMELEDTYSNIPEDEVEAAEASQLPDDEMVDTFQDFVLGEALTEDEQDMLSAGATILDPARFPAPPAAPPSPVAPPSPPSPLQPWTPFPRTSLVTTISCLSN